MVYRHDGTDDHDTDEFEPEFDDDFAPNDPGPKPEPEIHQFEYPGPSAYDIALSEN